MAKAEGEGEIYQRIKAHLAHHSSDNLSIADELSLYLCGICLTPGFGPRYCCGVCKLSIHRTCVSHLNGRTPCFLHPDKHCMSLQIVQEGAMKCHICGDDIAGYHYKCDDQAQDIHVHPICSRVRHAPADIACFAGRPLRHYSHGHALMEEYLPKRYGCDGCGTPGTGLRLRCGHCDFNLHPYCFSCPREQPCFLGHTQHCQCRLLLAAGSCRLRCHVCGGTIGRSEASLGMYYVCDVYNAFAHPLCAQFLHQERETSSKKTSENTDGVAKLLRTARRVGGKIIQRKVELALISGAFGTGAVFWDEFHASGDAGEAASKTLEFVADGISEKVEGVHEAFSTITGGVVDRGTDGLSGLIADGLDFLSNFF